MMDRLSVRSRKFLIAAYVMAMAGCNLSILFQQVPFLRRGYQDYTIYYMAGLLLRQGRAAGLYLLRVQYQTQLTFAPSVPIRSGALPFNHPPFEALLFVPFALLGFWHSYLLWTALNFLMLVGVVTLLRRFREVRDLHPALLGVCALAFFPLINGLLQGQDATLFLFFSVMAWTRLERGDCAAAGAWLACGLFRPHIAIPLALLLAVRWRRVLLGFVPVAVALAGITVTITGWGGALAYVRFVLQVERSGVGNFGPHDVPNLRGLLSSLVGPTSATLSALLIVILSVAALGLAMRRIRAGQDSVSHSFCLASVTALLVGFHLLSYDLTLILPLVLFLFAAAMKNEGRAVNPGRGLLVFLLFLTPLYVYLVYQAGRFFWFGLLVLALFWGLLRMRAPAAEVT
jgi:hypothetical protein